MVTTRRLLLPVMVALALLWQPASSFATLTGSIVENVGVKTAKLGLRDSTDAARIGGAYKRVKNTDYDFTVWEYRFGKRNAAGKYGLQMYSKGNHIVFTFVINCTTLKTKNGTHVGTTEATLAQRYGTKLHKSVGPVYTDYYMGTRNGRTDFWVKAGKVHHIVISRY